MKKEKIKLGLNILLLVVIIGVILFMLQGSLDEIIKEIRVTPWPIVAMITLVGLLSLLVEGGAIKRIIESLKIKFSILDGVFASCYMTFYRIVTFGSGTLISEVYYYRKKGALVSQSTGIVALRMMIYKIAVVAFGLIGLLTHREMLTNYENVGVTLVVVGLVLTSLIVLVLIVLTGNVNAQVLFVSIANRLLKKEKLRDVIDRGNLQIYSLRETVQQTLKNPAALMMILFFNILKLILWYSIPYLVLKSSHQQLDYSQIVFLTSFVVILAGVIPAPGGLGSFEFVYLLLFKPIVGEVDATSSMLLYRFVTYFLPFLIGMGYVFATKRLQIKKELHEVKEMEYAEKIVIQEKRKD